MKILVANTKGGVGKTTIALHAAIERARAGRRVWVVDGDRQATAQSALTLRAEEGQQPGVACATYPDGQTLRVQVQQQADQYDDVIIDAGGRDSTALRAGLMLADRVVVPFFPRSYDVWALEDMAELVAEARAVRDIDAVVVLNAADPAGKDNAEAVEAVEDIAGLRYIDAPLGRRKAYANAAGAGLSVTELPARQRDRKAESEIERLIDSIFI